LPSPDNTPDLTSQKGSDIRVGAPWVCKTGRPIAWQTHGQTASQSARGFWADQ